MDEISNSVKTIQRREKENSNDILLRKDDIPEYSKLI